MFCHQAWRTLVLLCFLVIRAASVKESPRAETESPRDDEWWKSRYALRKGNLKSSALRRPVVSSGIELAEKTHVALFVQLREISHWPELLSCVSQVSAANPMHYVVDAFITLPNLQFSQAHRQRLENSLAALPSVNEHFINVFDSSVHGPFAQFMLQWSEVGGASGGRRPASGSYKFFLKIHDHEDDEWRARNIESLCGSSGHVLSSWKAMNHNPALAFIAPLGSIVSAKTEMDRIFPPLRERILLRGSADGDGLGGLFDEELVHLVQVALSVAFPDTRKQEPLQRDQILCAFGQDFWVRAASFEGHRLKSKVGAVKSLVGSDSNISVDELFSCVVSTRQAMKGAVLAEMSPAPRILATYLPQYHDFAAIGQRWETKNATDWNLLQHVTDGDIRRPLTPDKGGLGMYDLLDTEVRRRQGELALKAGVTGFVYSHYWFSGVPSPKDHKYMNKVLDAMLVDGQPDLPFALSWQNEPWTRNWKGYDNELGGIQLLLMNQDYGDKEVWKEHFAYLLGFFKHPNYITVGSKPLFIVNSVGHGRDVFPQMFEEWDRLAIRHGFAGLHVVKALGNSIADDAQTTNMVSAGYHAWPNIRESGFNPTTKCASVGDFPAELRTQYWGAFTGFDPRLKGVRSRPLVVHPATFMVGLDCAFTAMAHSPGRDVRENFFFVSSWNEWGHQAVLEPDDTHRFRFLQGLQKMVNDFPVRVVHPLNDEWRLKRGCRKKED